MKPDERQQHLSENVGSAAVKINVASRKCEVKRKRRGEQNWHNLTLSIRARARANGYWTVEKSSALLMLL
uniref:Uncharacterized protein n=1 Tax=Ascaris lumbricoides TaxID=6252 RepID=A0A9J2P0I9_ASCLU